MHTCSTFALLLTFSGLSQPRGPSAWQTGLVAGLWVGQTFQVFYRLGFGLAVPAPGLLGTHPPLAMQALICISTKTGMTQENYCKEKNTTLSQ